MLSSARQCPPLLARDADATHRPHLPSRGVTPSFDVQRDGSPPVVLIIAGTRPECIKLAPVVRRLAGHPRLRMVVVNSGQHCFAVSRTFAEFDILEVPDAARLADYQWRRSAERQSALYRTLLELDGT